MNLADQILATSYTSNEDLSARLEAIKNNAGLNSPYIDSLFAKFTELTQEIEQATARLSALPTHPYERLKAGLFPPNYQFKTIENVRVPENFNPQAAGDKFKNILKRIDERASSQFHSLTSEETESYSDLFTTLSGDVPVPDTKAHKGHIEFLELARTITPEHIQDFPMETAMKVISQALKCYSKL